MIKSIFVILVDGCPSQELAGQTLSTKSICRLQHVRLLESSVLPAPVRNVYCGLGKAQLEASNYLGLTPNFYTPFCGTGAICSDNFSSLMLPGGKIIDRQKVIVPDSRDFLKSLPDEAVLVSDPSILEGAGLPKASSGAVIRLAIDDDPLCNIAVETEYSIIFGEELAETKK